MGLGKLFGGGLPLRRPVPPEEAAQPKLASADERAVMANLALHLWQAVADSFRADEQAHEAARFGETAGAVAEQVAALPADRAPDAALTRRILHALTATVHERILGLSERIDHLVAAAKETERELQTIKLATAWQNDELERCRSMITEALRGRETLLPGGPGGTQPLISELLATLLNVQRPPPPTQVHEGRRAQRDQAERVDAPPKPVPATGSMVDTGLVRSILLEVLDGQSTPGRLGRLLSDQELAARIGSMADDNRTYRGLLVRIGLLPRPN